MADQKSSAAACSSCRSPRLETHCKLCDAPLCRKCVLAPPQGAFFYLWPLPEELSHICYCQNCFQDKVEPALAHYETTLAQAREVFVFFTTQRKAIPVLKKAKEKISIDLQEDRDDTILKLAYLAADQGYNAIVECDLKSEKKRNEGYQHSVWKGSAFPAQVDAEKVEERFR